jgi:hypothetical protein
LVAFEDLVRVRDALVVMFMGSSDPGATAAARSCAELERTLRRNLSLAEFRCIWVCERTPHDP